MADNDMDKQKLAYFQEITGVKDESLSHQILDAYAWDLDSAIQAMVDKNTNAIPEYEESMRDSAVTQQPGVAVQVPAAASAASAESRDPEFRVPESSAGLAGVSAPVAVAAAAAAAEASFVDDRSLFERIGDGPEPSSSSSSSSVVAGATLVWRVVTLPLLILRGSYNLLYGVVGLSFWILGGVLSTGLGALRLTGSPSQGVEMRGRNLPRVPSIPSGATEASNFLRSYERRFGDYHPEFQAVSFMEALRKAGEEFKFLFVYLHAPRHVSTPAFCEKTLRNEVVVDFINENFIAWGADVHKTEGYLMSNSLNASTFPFCAVIAGSSSERIAVVRQVEGYKTASELLSMLQQVVEDQSASLIAGRLEQETREMNCRLIEEQNEAYRVGLLADQERERREQALADQEVSDRFDADQKRIQDEKEAAQGAEISAQKQANLTRQRHDKALNLAPEPEWGPDVTHVAVRLPSGERKNRRFPKTATVQMLYDYVESLDVMESENYLLVSNFPLVEYGPDKLELTLQEAGIHPRSSLLLQTQGS